MKKLLFFFIISGLVVPTQLFAAGEVSFDVDGTGPQVTIDGTGLKLESGSSADEISNDGNLAGDDPNTIPTEQAVKAYVDGKVVTSGTVDFSSPSETAAPSVKAVKEFVGSVAPGRNFIICGRFDDYCWPEGTSFTDMTNLAYGPVSFKFNKASTAKLDLSQGAGSTEATQHSAHSLRLDVTTADTSIGAGDVVALAYFVTGYDLATMWGKNVTLSFHVKAARTGTYCVAFRNRPVTRTYITEYTIATAGTWQEVSVTIPFDEPTGTWSFDHEEGMSILFSLMGGTNAHGTADSWLDTASSPTKIMTSNQVNGVAATSDNFSIDLVKLEVGDAATDWTPYVWSESIPSLEWYFERLEPAAGGDGDAIIGSGQAISATEAMLLTPMKRKREAPSFSESLLSEVQVTCGSTTRSVNSLAFSMKSTTGARAKATITGTPQYSAGDGCYYWLDGGYIDIDARH